ncbi:unnamed protein product [Paramecium primaurelia]|uniref:Uncharacterized protein n=1 Tax=Paramecium primaurelia TaxID=5886 RepID=A0A8S1LAA7_PARPR|nr:unnamed protein product [Paramecium primaurelia]
MIKLIEKYLQKIFGQMQQFWDIEKFKTKEPNKFLSLGNQFVNELKINIKEITNMISNKKFGQSFIHLIEISCQSKKVDAERLSVSVSILKNYLDVYLEQQEGIIQEKDNFQQEQQKQAAKLFIDIISAAKLSIHDWQIFNQQVKQNDLFKNEMNNIVNVYEIPFEREYCECQIA